MTETTFCKNKQNKQTRRQYKKFDIQQLIKDFTVPFTNDGCLAQLYNLFITFCNKIRYDI